MVEKTLIWQCSGGLSRAWRGANILIAFFSQLFFIVNMEDSLAEGMAGLLKGALGYELGSLEFNIMLVVCLATWVIVARVFMTMFSTKRGFLAAFLACVISLTAGIVGYMVAEFYLIPGIAADWADEVVQVLPLAGLVGFILLSVFFLTGRILKLSVGSTLFVYIVATTVSACAYFGVKVGLGVMETGGTTLEQREQRMQRELESMY
ncbi:MAG: hypothetical protein EA353_08680 [Puniceicoccaceae bacterium]|nr:MAG: hypothetical protein EA353_08680 [Puniceicoccaceae bacterium]